MLYYLLRSKQFIKLVILGDIYISFIKKITFQLLRVLKRGHTIMSNVNGTMIR